MNDEDTPYDWIDKVLSYLTGFLAALGVIASIIFFGFVYAHYEHAQRVEEKKVATASMAKCGSCRLEKQK